jgi:hypothetical protein
MTSRRQVIYNGRFLIAPQGDYHSVGLSYHSLIQGGVPDVSHASIRHAPHEMTRYRGLEYVSPIIPAFAALPMPISADDLIHTKRTVIATRFGKSLITANGPSRVLHQDECAICWEELTGVVKTLDCGHEYHQECMAPLPQRQGVSIEYLCPMCRSYHSVVTPVKYIPLDIKTHFEVRYADYLVSSDTVAIDDGHCGLEALKKILEPTAHIPPRWREAYGIKLSEL